ncbi:flagellar biosynthesis protein FlhF [Bacillus weihaiensis]|uniref:Flagellar biosynthesis protein FlhF n=1 Tax=Bacillus weihaiensis TaxID=1547283 RepID=A0A1L3MSC1_9BACI|nr:flagellar biosynthesis protein FlhF [Bacillus weihaiensis]APH05241.1 flagellar biosynthesis protein FlhF [Bacillus weihaiensis]
MKVKKYVAPSMQEAMKKIRAEMGNDAVILNSKMVQTGGFLGLFSKKMIEVIAANDPDVPSKKIDQKKETYQSMIETSELKENKQKLHISSNNDSLLHEIKEMKALLQHFSVTENKDIYPNLLQEMQNKMMKQDIPELVRATIMGSLLEYWYQEKGQLTFEQIKQQQEEILYEMLAGIEFGGISYQKKFINVIGPTGVGKTTTLAKLAAECVIQKKKKVAFITTDTYRIAAIDQLKTYAKILDVPLEVCYSIEDFKNAQRRFSAYDYIFIDTAGRNFLDSRYVKDLMNIIDFEHEMETFLVLSATAKSVDMIAVYEQFSIIPIDKLIFTKLDETSTRGTLLDIMLQTKKGIAYTTHGQNVPDDIETASREKIVNQILR